MQEPQKATLKYLFELVAALKHNLSIRVSTTPLFLNVSLIRTVFDVFGFQMQAIEGEVQGPLAKGQDQMETDRRNNEVDSKKSTDNT